MAIYDIPFSSVAAVAVNTDIANIVAGTASGYKLRRLFVTMRVTSGAPANQQCGLALYLATARGTQTSTTAPEPHDKSWMAATAPIPGVDLTWSAGATKGNLKGVAWVNATGGGFDFPLEGEQGIVIPIGTANGLILHNIGQALPANHQWSVWATVET